MRRNTGIPEQKEGFPIQQTAKTAPSGSGREYLDFILDQLSGLEDITYRPMMGEYLLYYHGKLFGGIYDNRFLVKPVNAALALMPEAERELPYPGGKEMLLVENVDNREFLAALLNAMENDLPSPRKKKREQ